MTEERAEDQPYRSGEKPVERAGPAPGGVAGEHEAPGEVAGWSGLASDEVARESEPASGAEIGDDAAERRARDPRVAAALDRMDELADLPPSEHAEVYEDVHRTLQAVLADASGQGHENRGGEDPGR